MNLRILFPSKRVGWKRTSNCYIPYFCNDATVWHPCTVLRMYSHDCDKVSEDSLMIATPRIELTDHRSSNGACDMLKVLQVGGRPSIASEARITRLGFLRTFLHDSHTREEPFQRRRRNCCTISALLRLADSCRPRLMHDRCRDWSAAPLLSNEVTDHADRERRCVGLIRHWRSPVGCGKHCLPWHVSDGAS